MTFTTNSCYDCCLSYPAYGCIYTPYNDTAFYEALAASGALSLGTSAGTDRSISAEFGGTTPHGLSEYYGCATGIPASGAIDFSDFHGTSSGPPVTNCLWTHYDFAECTTGTIDKWGTTALSTECQCMRAYWWRCCTNPGVVAIFCPVVCHDTSGSCICKDSSCWNGNAFLGFTPITPSNFGQPVRPVGVTHTGRPNWLAACYGTGTAWIDPDCAANTKFMVFGGQHAVNNYFTPWAHNGMLGMSQTYGTTTFCLDDTSAIGRCAGIAGCGALCMRNGPWIIRQQFEELINNCNMAGQYVYGFSCSGYEAGVQWCTCAASDCAILSRASTNGPVVMSLRVNPTSSSVYEWPGYGRFTIGWIQKDCTPIIDATHFWDSDPPFSGLRNYWDDVRTNIPCAGFDFWNVSGSFSAQPHYTWTDIVDCFQVGEFLVYNCSLTDAEYCSVLNYLYEKWQEDM